MNNESENKNELESAISNQEQTPSKKSKSIARSGISLSVLTLFSRIMGLIREMTKAKFLGTSAYSDAFGIAFMIPNLCRRLFAENSISVAFIPTFKGYLEDNKGEDGKKVTQEFICSTFTLVTFLTVIFVSLGMIFTPWILRIFYNTESLDAMNEGIVLTRIMFPYLVVISVAAFFQGILNGLKIFSPSGFTPILFNGIVVLLTYILAPRMANPARAMAVGVITGGCVQAIFQLPFVLKNNWKIYFTSLKKAFTNPGTRKVISLVVPTILGMACYQVNDVVSSALATRAGEGVVSSLQYSLRLQELILGIFAVSIGTVILPDLTGFAKKLEWNKFNGLLTSSIKIISVIAIPVTFYAFFMGENIITLVFGTGRFDAESVALTNKVFRYHIIGLDFIALNRIISPAFYAQQNTKSPTLAGILNFVVNIIVALCLVKPMGGEGIALALTVASAVNTILLFIFLRKNKTIGVGKIAGSTILYSLKMVLFSLLALVPVYFIKDPLVNFFQGHSRFISQGIPVLITAIAFGITGVICLVITKDQSIKAITKKFRR